MCFQIQIPKVMVRLSLRPSMYLTILGILCNQKMLLGARIGGQTPIPMPINPKPNSMCLTKTCQVPRIIWPCNSIDKGITLTCINNPCFHYLLGISGYLRLLTHHPRRHLLPWTHPDLHCCLCKPYLTQVIIGYLNLCKTLTSNLFLHTWSLPYLWMKSNYDQER